MANKSDLKLVAPAAGSISDVLAAATDSVNNLRQGEGDPVVEGVAAAIAEEQERPVDPAPKQPESHANPVHTDPHAGKPQNAIYNTEAMATRVFFQTQRTRLEVILSEIDHQAEVLEARRADVLRGLKAVAMGEEGLGA
jgi:hypothetical protein